MDGLCGETDLPANMGVREEEAAIAPSLMVPCDELCPGYLSIGVGMSVALLSCSNYA